MGLKRGKKQPGKEMDHVEETVSEESLGFLAYGSITFCRSDRKTGVRGLDSFAVSR